MSTLIKLPELVKVTGLSKSTIYDYLNAEGPRYDSSFPKAVPIGTRARAWDLDEVEAWIARKAGKVPSATPKPVNRSGERRGLERGREGTGIDGVVWKLPKRRG